MENPDLGSASVLNQWENEGKSLTKWDLCRVVKELRKYKRHDRALEVKEKKRNKIKACLFIYLCVCVCVCCTSLEICFNWL